MMPAQYSSSFKVDVIHRFENGETIKDLSHELHIAQSTIYRWRKDHRSIQATNCTYTPAEFDVISRRLQKLEHEMEIILNSGYITGVPLQKRLLTLESIYCRSDNPYSVRELCDALGVARGTFYNHIFRRTDRKNMKQNSWILCREYNKFLMTVASGMVLRKFVSFWQRVEFEPVRSGFRYLCRNWVYGVSVQMRRKNIKSGSSTQNEIYWNGNSLQTVQIKYGSVTLRILELMEIGFTSA